MTPIVIVSSRAAAPRTLAPLAVTARDVITRAKSLAALANGIDANIGAIAASVPDAEFAAWKIEYVRDAAVIDPWTDPFGGIVLAPWSAWNAMDAVEPSLIAWRTKVNAWGHLDVPVPAPTHDPTPTLPPLPSIDGTTKFLIGGGLALGILIAWKV